MEPFDTPFTQRQAGVLMPLASLPSHWGVGDLGPNSYDFVNLLADTGVRVWQILPLNPLGFGNSPYQPYSSFAGDPLYISPELLQRDGLLGPLVQKEPVQNRIDYNAARARKEQLCRLAFERFVPDEAYEDFLKLEWVSSYAVFITLKKKNDLRCWLEWPKEQKDWPLHPENLDLSPYVEDIAYETFVQYLFYSQWNTLKQYANQKGIRILGDIPFYVGVDSQDVWMGRQNFLLDEEGHPTCVAGVPPDYFSPTGQRWGNPVYNWDQLRETGYDFWLKRLGYAATLFDILRIDHFRAFDTYWKIPASCETAIEGAWLEAPGYEVLESIRQAMPDTPIVAEDLGELRGEVYTLRDHFHFPGMRIVQFTMEPGEEEKQSADTTFQLVYTGTHDNETMAGWYGSKTPELQQKIREILEKQGCSHGNIAQQLVYYTLQHAGFLAIIPVQDILGLGNEARLNTPGTLGSPNWEWKLTDFDALRKALPFFARQLKETQRA